jgi:hypothetical protein
MKKLIASVILMLACFCFSASAQPGHYRHNRPYRGYDPALNVVLTTEITTRAM